MGFKEIDIWGKGANEVTAKMLGGMKVVYKRWQYYAIIQMIQMILKGRSLNVGGWKADAGRPKVLWKLEGTDLLVALSQALKDRAEYVSLNWIWPNLHGLK